MSIYLAHPTDPNSSQSVSPAVLDRGLSLYKSKPCDVQVCVLPDLIQPAYACYLKNLPAFIEATLAGKSVAISNRGYPIVIRVPHLFPVRIPDLIYDFPGFPKAAQVEDLRTHSTMIDGRGKDKQFVMRSPNLEKIQTLVKKYPNVNQKTRHVIGTVNLDAMKMVFTIQRILSAFLLTHHYPAFRHESDVSPVAEMDTITTVTKKRKVSDTAYIECVTKLTENVDNDAMIDDDKVTNIGSGAQDPANIRLTVAKATKIVNDKWGDIENIPNASGIYVPFVKELAIGDTITLPTLMSTYFLRCFSDNPGAMFKAMEKLKSAWGVIATTDAGHELSHLAKCIDIALQAQATIYPVFTNYIYEGCVISGAGFSVSLKGESIRPLSFMNLQTVVSDSSAHNKALSDINDVLSEDGQTAMEHCDSMRELAAIVTKERLDDLDRQKIVKAAHSLNFKNKYWATSVVNIRYAMVFIRNPAKEIDNDIPMHPKYLFTNDRIESILSAFGHQAPTFMIPNAAKCLLAMKDPPKNLHVRTATVETAVQDMKFIMERGYITNNNQNLSSKHRDTPIRGEDKTRIWNALREMSNGGTPVDAEANPQVMDNVEEKNVLDSFW